MNLIIENRQGDFLISKKSISTYHGEPINRLVEFKELTDNNSDENEWGQIRLWRSGIYADDVYTLQLRGKHALTENGKKRNLIATARLTLSDMQKIVSIAEEISGQTVLIDSDLLRIRIQELEAQVMKLKLQLKDKNDALQLAIEG